jgi:hypothetical protein
MCSQSSHSSTGQALINCRSCGSICDLPYSDICPFFHQNICSQRFLTWLIRWFSIHLQLSNWKWLFLQQDSGFQLWLPMMASHCAVITAAQCKETLRALLMLLQTVSCHTVTSAPFIWEDMCSQSCKVNCLCRKKQGPMTVPSHSAAVIAAQSL